MFFSLTTGTASRERRAQFRGTGTGIDSNLSPPTRTQRIRSASIQVCMCVCLCCCVCLCVCVCNFNVPAYCSCAQCALWSDGSGGTTLPPGDCCLTQWPAEHSSATLQNVKASLIDTSQIKKKSGVEKAGSRSSSSSRIAPQKLADAVDLVVQMF